ncbi:MAG: type II toxin-antitoxin system VapC family toxin [Trueperaceae bacterium]|nr:type II toxin-antitoxin system VapC family toxin [Trueperaceae bacterium]
MSVLDASALLAFLQDEVGGETVASSLEDGAHCSAANWSEVAQKIRSKGRNWDLSRALLLAYGLQIEPVTQDDAELAAKLWRAGSGMSLADRLCVALGRRLKMRVLTADEHWGTEKPIVQIR